MQRTELMYPRSYYMFHKNEEGWDKSDPRRTNAYIIFKIVMNQAEAFSGRNANCCGLPAILIKAFYEKSKRTHYQDEYAIAIAISDEDDLDNSLEVIVSDAETQKKIFQEMVNYVLDRKTELIGYPYEHMEKTLIPYMKSLVNEKEVTFYEF